MNPKTNNRRSFLKSMINGSLLAAFSNAYSSDSINSKKILVVLELSGGNDGLNTLVPYQDDNYYRLRPNIHISRNKVRKIDDQFGFNPGMSGFERIFKDGEMAIVHGCGYENPSFSHFTSMSYWHTGAPNSGEQFGWLGRVSDKIDPAVSANFAINIDATQSLAVKAKNHVPVVFDDPARFTRKGLRQQRYLLNSLFPEGTTDNNNRRFLENISRGAKNASNMVKNAWAEYKSPIDYGIVPLDLPKIAALISYGLPTQVYYTSYRNNAFDTHVQQNNLHQRLLTYVSDAVAGFCKDMKRIGRDKDVTLLIFSEFGRRVRENTSLGTDHGTANHMYVIGKRVHGGHYGVPPSLTNLDQEQNLAFTTDFRRVYATLIENWFDYQESENILTKKYKTFPMFTI